MSLIPRGFWNPFGEPQQRAGPLSGACTNITRRFFSSFRISLRSGAYFFPLGTRSRARALDFAAKVCALSEIGEKKEDVCCPFHGCFRPSRSFRRVFSPLFSRVNIDPLFFFSCCSLSLSLSRNIRPKTIYAGPIRSLIRRR